MDGFFSRAEMTVRPRQSLLPQCDHCGLHKHARSPFMKPSGRGRRRVLLVGERPGGWEDERGTQFVGESGELLRDRLERIGVDMRRDCWLDNALRCFTPKPDYAPSSVADCRPNLLNTIKELRPDVIVLMGRPAIWSLIGHLWGDVGVSIRWIGQRIPSHALNAWVCPTHNPAYIIREEKKGEHGDPVPSLEFDRDLTTAFALDGPPFPDGPPDYASRVECIHDPDEAAARLSRYTGGTVAWDIETTTLKPDGRHAELVSCSVCWEGEETISFPWVGAARGAMVELLENPDVEKVGWNDKMEDRWARRLLGCRVRGWKWDGMLAAHAIDPRKGTTGLKFQTFVRLGVPPYNEAVAPYLESAESGGNAPNRIREIDLRRLLLYGGLDSLFEFEVAKIQMAEIGV